VSKHVNIVEVGPRDGLQNEPRPISVADKIALVDLLSRSGLTRIECASFVSPKWVPQMAGSAEVLAGITRANGVRYTALTPNMRGLEDALAAKADEVAVFASASEGFSKANINATIAESLDRFAPLVEHARAADTPVRGYVSCIVACPYDGPTAPEKVAYVAKALLDMGCYQVSLGDTIGAATPDTLTSMLEAVLHDTTPDQLAGHFHDTHGTALANIDAALALGLRTFDSAVGGLGGCPYAPGASGNVATEAVLAHLTTQGITTGLNVDIINEAAKMARTLIGASHV
jgi:hydroxymethylglutaryl-CoA lyase